MSVASALRVRACFDFLFVCIHEKMMSGFASQANAAPLMNKPNPPNKKTMIESLQVVVVQ